MGKLELTTVNVGKRQQLTVVVPIFYTSCISYKLGVKQMRNLVVFRPLSTVPRRNALPPLRLIRKPPRPDLIQALLLNRLIPLYTFPLSAH